MNDSSCDHPTLPSGWAWVRQGDVSTARMGKTILARELTQSGIPVYSAGRSRDPWGYLPESDLTFGPNTIVLSARGNIGFPKLPTRVPFVSTQTTIAVSYEGPLVPAFFMYFLQNFEFAKLTSQTTIPMMTVRQVNGIDLPVAPAPEQHRIVSAIEAHFTRLDSAVATMERVQANLKRYRASVLKAAVDGRLVPTEAELARLEGRDYEPASVLLKRVLQERRRCWKETVLEGPEGITRTAKYSDPMNPDISSLPQLPRGWAWATTDQLLEFVTSGSRGWARYYTEDGPLFLRIGNLDHGSIRLDLSDCQRVSPPAGAEGKRTRVRVGDILISITADVGMVGIVDNDLGEAYINQHVALARPTQLLHRPFLAWYLASEDGGQRQLRQLQRGATKMGLGLDDIKRVMVPIPPLAEQIRIVSEIDRKLSIMTVVTASAQRSSIAIGRIRRSILKWAFDGKLVDQDPNDEPAAALLARVKEAGLRTGPIKTTPRKRGTLRQKATT